MGLVEAFLVVKKMLQRWLEAPATVDHCLKQAFPGVVGGFCRDGKSHFQGCGGCHRADAGEFRLSPSHVLA